MYTTPYHRGLLGKQRNSSNMTPFLAATGEIDPITVYLNL